MTIEKLIEMNEVNDEGEPNWLRVFEDADEMNFSHITRVHPCFDLSEKREAKVGRVHLPVSPACNIQCKFCSRSFDKTEDRPGVTSVILSPEQAVSVAGKAIQKCPYVRVVGFAGPGDPLASDHAIQTLELLDGRFSHLFKCLSTNGLKLEEKAKRLSDLGVRTITVSAHAVDPKLATKAYGNVRSEDKILKGVEATEKLIRAQISGIEEAVRRGLIVKVNTVLIPGINQAHIEDIARTVSDAGASIINIIPLIPQYKMSHIPSPTCKQLREAREKAEKILPVFRHCQQCRADAIGIPGRTECSNLIYEELGLNAPEVPNCTCL